MSGQFSIFDKTLIIGAPYPLGDKMRTVVNGIEKELPDGTTVAQAIQGEPYVPGSSVALIRPMDAQRKLTNEYMVKTSRGQFIIQLNTSSYADAWKDIYRDVIGKNLRWQTSRLHAFGSFPTQFQGTRGTSSFKRYDCFFALGGFDASTTYFIISRIDMNDDLGLKEAVFGRVTKGRHVLDRLEEGDIIEGIEPVVLRMTSKDAFATVDLTVPVEDGMSIETYVGVKLDERSPLCCEHFLVVASEGSLPIDEKGFSYSACETNMDTNLGQEYSDVRQPNTVTVRHKGYQAGKIYFYNQVRQMNRSHNQVGNVTNGFNLVHLVPVEGNVLVKPDPMRIMTIGMSQVEAKVFLEARGLKQKRTGDVSDDAVIVEQEPEMTIFAIKQSEIETMGVPSEKIFSISMDAKESPWSVRYFRKITGLDHKSIGTLKVHFTFEDMPMITFEGDPVMAADLYPERLMGPSVRGDVAITNMSRPQKGLVGIRLEDSDEFGPTGEEAHGTNVLGRFVGDLDRMMKDIQEGDIIYVRKVLLDEFVEPEKKAKTRATKKAPVGMDKEKTGTSKKPSKRSQTKKVNGVGTGSKKSTKKTGKSNEQ
ncbi:MAG: methanogenesis marker 3 protein [Methanomassiliicoccus sp.]|nr:MAG: methanogenesis marker 3 protein [Methanomassiliicoccus sp.]